jgi:hypothetical protein
LNENFDHGTAPQHKGVAETEDDIPLIGIFPSHVQCAPPHVGPTLIRLSNARRNASRGRLYTIRLFGTIAPFIQELCSRTFHIHVQEIMVVRHVLNRQRVALVRIVEQSDQIL